jgi:hypothetical protein
LDALGYRDFTKEIVNIDNEGKKTHYLKNEVGQYVDPQSGHILQNFQIKGFKGNSSPIQQYLDPTLDQNHAAAIAVDYDKVPLAKNYLDLNSADQAYNDVYNRISDTKQIDGEV